MNKKVLVIIASCVIPVTLIGCTPKTTKAPTGNTTINATKETENTKKDVKTFNKDNFGIVFEYPSFFEKVKNNDGDQSYALYKIGNEGSSFNVVVEKVKDTMKLDDYVASSFGEFEKQSNAKKVSSKNFDLNGFNFNETVSTLEMSNNKGILKLNQVTLLDKGYAYVFTYGSPEKNYDKNLGDYQDILKTVKEKGATGSPDVKDSNDPVYKAMMNPNTELGKIYANINELQSQIEKNSDERAKKELENKKALLQEKEDKLKQIEQLKEEKKKYKSDDIHYTWTQNEIDKLQTQVDNNYKDIN